MLSTIGIGEMLTERRDCKMRKAGKSPLFFVLNVKLLPGYGSPKMATHVSVLTMEP